MNYKLNTIYGILTNGDNTHRRTTENTPDKANIIRWVRALIPGGTTPAGVRALTELYIRLCMTDKKLYLKLLQVDPINSYKLQSFYEDFTDEAVLENILQGIRDIGILDESTSALPFDTIRQALDQFLDAVNG